MRPRFVVPTGQLAWPTEESTVSAVARAGEPPTPADVAYCPTGDDGGEGLAARIESSGAAGCARIVHAFPGEVVSSPADAILVWDLLAPLLESEGAQPEAIRRLRADRPAKARLWLAVPLLAGLFRDEDDLAASLAAARDLDPECVVGAVPDATPADRRRLAERLGEARFEAVFHGEPPTERAFATLAEALGLAWRAPRPAPPGLAPRHARNRELAAALTEAGELWLRLERAEPEGLALLAAARRVDETGLDLAALARERNLDVVEWLPPLARAIVAELALAGRSARLEELATAWSRPAPRERRA